MAAAAAPGDASRGAVWAELGSCGACHTAEEGAPYAGGHAIETDRGTFYGPNITPDPTHGIGEWTYDDFVRAMRHGRSPAGHTYWPAFPYPAYTHLRDAELADLWAYLRTLSPSDRPDQRHAVRIPMARCGDPGGASTSSRDRSSMTRPGRPSGIAGPTWARASDTAASATPRAIGSGRYLPTRCTGVLRGRPSPRPTSRPALTASPYGTSTTSRRFSKTG